MKRLFFVKFLTCIIVIIFVALFGTFFIKDAANDLAIMTPGFRNLTQVIIHADGKLGRGVIIYSDNEYVGILTAKHVVSNDPDPVVEFGNEERAQATVWYYYSEHDAAIIQVDKSQMEVLDISPKPAEILSKDEYGKLTQGEEVFYGSNLLDTQLEVATGTWVEGDRFIDIVQENAGVYEGTVTSGMSGTGVFTKNGKLIGIIVAADETTGVVIPAYRIVDISGGNNE